MTSGLLYPVPVAVLNLRLDGDLVNSPIATAAAIATVSAALLTFAALATAYALEFLLEWVRNNIGDETGSVLLVGHQPTWSLFAGGLIGGGQLRYPTAALAKIRLHVDRWRDIDYGRGELVWFQLPRALKSIGFPGND